MCDEYNGWSNYPTWAVALWLGNDEDLYRSVKIQRTDEALKEFIEEEVKLDDLKGMAHDLMTFVLNKVDWQEILDSFEEEEQEPEESSEDEEDEDEEEPKYEDSQDGSSDAERMVWLEKRIRWVKTKVSKQNYNTDQEKQELEV